MVFTNNNINFTVDEKQKKTKSWILQRSAASCSLWYEKCHFSSFFMGSNQFFSDPFEKLNLEVWASTLQSMRRRARTRPLIYAGSLHLWSLTTSLWPKIVWAPRWSCRVGDFLWFLKKKLKIRFIWFKSIFWFFSFQPPKTTRSQPKYFSSTSKSCQFQLCNKNQTNLHSNKRYQRGKILNKLWRNQG